MPEDQGMVVADTGPMVAADAAQPVTMECMGCIGLQTCNGETGECEEPAVCDADEDCFDGRICEDTLCQPGCGDMGCPTALVCDSAGRRCPPRTIFLILNENVLANQQN